MASPLPSQAQSPLASLLQSPSAPPSQRSQASSRVFKVRSSQFIRPVPGLPRPSHRQQQNARQSAHGTRPAQLNPRHRHQPPTFVPVTLFLISSSAVPTCAPLPLTDLPPVPPPYPKRPHLERRSTRPTVLHLVTTPKASASPTPGPTNHGPRPACRIAGLLHFCTLFQAVCTATANHAAHLHPGLASHSAPTIRCPLCACIATSPSFIRIRLGPLSSTPIACTTFPGATIVGTPKQHLSPYLATRLD